MGSDDDGKVSVPFDELPRRQRRNLVLRAILRTVVTVTALVIVYFIAPMDRGMSPLTITELVLLALAVFAVTGWEVWRITKSEYPTLRAVESLGFVLPAYVLLFACTYYLANHANSAWFGVSLSRIDSLYFSSTVFTTVGFGDITAKTETARVLVTCQMMLDLVIVGLVVRLIVNAIKIGQKHRAA